MLIRFMLFGILLGQAASVAQSQTPAPALDFGPLFKAELGGQPLELHEFLQGSFGLFELTRPVEVEITTGFDLRGVDIRPRSAGVTPVIGSDHSSVRFQLKNTTPITIEFNCDIKKVIHLFPYAPEKDAPKPGDANVRYFGAGMHEPGLMELKDGETLYLAPGAWVKGNVRSIGTKNVVVRGRGVLDGSNVPRQQSSQPRPAGSRPTPGSRNLIYLEKTEGARIEGITIFNSVSWTVYLRNSKGARINGVKVLNPSVNYGNDGFDIVSSSDVIVEDTFVRTNDDCVVVKNMDDVDVHDIIVRKAVFWNMPTGGNGVEIGFELRNQPVHHIRFEDIDIIHVERGAAISIHNGDASTVHDILFDNIRVEDVRRKLIDFAVIFAQYGLDRPASQEERSARMDPGGAWDGLQRFKPEEKPQRAKFRGHIKDVHVRNLHVVEGALPYSVIAGFDDEHAVDNVLIEGLKYQGRHIRGAAEGRFSIDSARGIKFK